MTQTSVTKQEKYKILKEAQSGIITHLKAIKQKQPNFHWCDLRYDVTGDTILHCAARLGYIEILEYLLTQFTPYLVDCKNVDDKTALHEAAQFSQYKSCILLIEYGANINAIKRADWTPLMLACTKSEKTSLSIVELLLNSGAFIDYKNKDGWSAIHLTCREGCLEIFDVLIKYGADINILTKNGRSVLHIAALHGNINIVKTLINLGFNVNIKDGCGNNPLHEAVLGRNMDICNLLIEHNAEVYATNNADFSLLHLAASEGYVDLINYLLQKLKFDVNLKNSKGFTPLHCAARKKQNEAFDFLIKNGANDEIKDNYERLAQDYLKL